MMANIVHKYEELHIKVDTNSESECKLHLHFPSNDFKNFITIL